MKESKQEEIIGRILDAKKIYIYGAGIIGYGVYKSLREYYGVSVSKFLVTDQYKNASKIEGIPVIPIDRFKDFEIEDLILVATPEVYHEEIIQTLKSKGIGNYICISSELEYFIMSKYFKKEGRFKLLEDELRNIPRASVQSADIGVYMAKCHLDPPLKKNYILPYWIKPIQVGAKLTDIHIADITDDTGENISEKNRNYSELTATYWVWKNTSHQYKGICHYRRMLVLSEEGIKRLEMSDIDVILPLPFVCQHNTSDQYGRYISRDDFQVVMRVLKENSQEYYEAAKAVYADKYIYNYNMLIAKQEVFDDYCSWLFPILEQVEKICEPPGKPRQDRYIGYIGEILTALYFLYNKNGLKIVHAEKKWMV